MSNTNFNNFPDPLAGHHMVRNTKHIEKYCIKETLNLSMCADISNNIKKKNQIAKYLSCVICYVSHITRHNHVSTVSCHRSPVPRHLTTTLCSLSCYESPRMLGDAAEGYLVIDREKKKKYAENHFH